MLAFAIRSCSPLCRSHAKQCPLSFSERAVRLWVCVSTRTESQASNRAELLISDSWRTVELEKNVWLLSLIPKLFKVIWRRQERFSGQWPMDSRIHGIPDRGLSLVTAFDCIVYLTFSDKLQKQPHTMKFRTAFDDMQIVGAMLLIACEMVSSFPFRNVGDISSASQ